MTGTSLRFALTAGRLKLRLLALVGMTGIGFAGGNTSAAVAIQFEVTALGPVESSTDSGKSINNVGTAAFTVSTAVKLWSNGVTTTVPSLYAGNGPLAINDAGHLALADQLHAYIYRDGIKTDLGTFNGGYTFAKGINNHDVIVGESYDNSASRYRAFVWRGGGIERLPAPGGTYPLGAESRANDINESGAIAGSYENQSLTMAVVWSGGVATGLDTLSGYARSEGYGINDSQQVVGYSANSSYSKKQAVLWNGTTPTDLGSLPGHAYTVANAINASTMIVGAALQFESDTQGNAFLWMNGTMLDLNDLISPASGWHLISAMDINDHGQIVGYGTLNRVKQSFLLTPIVPEPSTFALASLALVCAIILRRCKR